MLVVVCVLMLLHLFAIIMGFFVVCCSFVLMWCFPVSWCCLCCLCLLSLCLTPGLVWGYWLVFGFVVYLVSCLFDCGLRWLA